MAARYRARMAASADRIRSALLHQFGILKISILFGADCTP
jgi:hypothetical protein